MKNKNIMKKNIRFIVLSCILTALIAEIIVLRHTPLKDGLYLRYETTRRGVDENTSHEFKFTKSKDGNFQVEVESTGLLGGKFTSKVNRYFQSENRIPLHGPIGAVIWINPHSLAIGKVVAAGEVIKEADWKGYDAYIIQDMFLPNCYGYYDKKTGLQVGYHNCWSVEKLTTILKESNIKIK